MTLRVEHVSHRTSGPEPTETTWALQNISFTAAAGQFVCVLGPPGAGKQLLLDIIAGFVVPTSGAVRVDGVRIHGPGPDRAVVFRRCALFPWLNLADNVAFGLQCQGISAGNARVVARAHLRKVELEHFAEAYPHQLSAAMRQRAAMARVWAIGSPIVLLDDPFAAVEQELKSRLRAQLLTLWRESGKTIVFVTEDADEAVQLAQRVIVLTPQPGRITADVHRPGSAHATTHHAAELYDAEEAAGIDPDSLQEGTGSGREAVFRRAVHEALAAAGGIAAEHSSTFSGGSGLRDGLSPVRFDVKT